MLEAQVMSANPCFARNHMEVYLTPLPSRASHMDMSIEGVWGNRESGRFGERISSSLLGRCCLDFQDLTRKAEERAQLASIRPPICGQRFRIRFDICLETVTFGIQVQASILHRIRSISLLSLFIYVPSPSSVIWDLSIYGSRQPIQFIFSPITDSPSLITYRSRFPSVLRMMRLPSWGDAKMTQNDSVSLRESKV